MEAPLRKISYLLVLQRQFATAPPTLSFRDQFRVEFLDGDLAEALGEGVQRLGGRSQLAQNHHLLLNI